MNLTEPSPMATFTPPGWLLRAVLAPSHPPPEPSEVKLPCATKKPLSAPVHDRVFGVITWLYETSNVSKPWVYIQLAPWPESDEGSVPAGRDLQPEIRFSAIATPAAP